MKKSEMGLIVLVLSSFSLPTFAADMPAKSSESTQHAPGMNMHHDINMQTQLREQFRKLDTNKDGVIDKQEARHDKALSKAFKDVAKKGKINETEYMHWQQLKKPRT